MVEELLEGANDMDELKFKARRQNSALEHCKTQLSQSDEPWNVDIKKVFEDKLKTFETKSKKKDKNSLLDNLKKHVARSKDDVVEVEKEVTQAIDPWTRTPILHPIQSTTCKHLYDKKSINCIIKNRPHFKCPYIGCQNVISKDQLIDLNDEDE